MAVLRVRLLEHEHIRCDAVYNAVKHREFAAFAVPPEVPPIQQLAVFKGNIGKPVGGRIDADNRALVAKTAHREAMVWSDSFRRST